VSNLFLCCHGLAPGVTGLESVDPDDGGDDDGNEGDDDDDDDEGVYDGELELES
jgi:hypothetical protein